MAAVAVLFAFIIDIAQYQECYTQGRNASGKYLLLDSLLFKLVTTSEKESALLTIPEICTDKIITLYHSTLFSGHQEVKMHALLLQTSSLYQALSITCDLTLRVATYVN